MALSLHTAIDSLEPPTPDRLRPVRIWLYILAFSILLMVAVGGMTRLTDSGLSITSWKPISGAIPPLTPADWQTEFEAYQQIPEFQNQNSWMDLAAFKYIFWWEWSHRFLGRVIGLLFAVPFVVFLVQKRLSWRLAPSLFMLFVLGGFQGFLGWWMVSSGLTQRVDVSQYRLAAHLGAASLLFAAILWVARRIRPALIDNQVNGGIAGRFAPMGHVVIWLLAVLVFLQILMGAFVAGIDAGFGYNTWPLMEGRWIPDGLGVMQPMWLNLFENALAVQFTHRVLAYVIMLVAFTAVIRAYMASWLGARWFYLIGVLVLAQALMGIFTLVLVVPIPLALAHQALAFMLFGTIVASTAQPQAR